jgi:hypothetical protein
MYITWTSPHCTNHYDCWDDYSSIQIIIHENNEEENLPASHYLKAEKVYPHHQDVCVYLYIGMNPRFRRNNVSSPICCKFYNIFWRISIHESFRVRVLQVTVNNISAISLRSVLLVEEAWQPGKNLQPVMIFSHTLYKNSITFTETNQIWNVCYFSFIVSLLWWRKP